MKLAFPKSLAPRSFYGRAVLILILPIIVIQIVVSVVFIQRHYERVTDQMTQNTLLTVGFAVRQVNDATTLAAGLVQAAPVLEALQITLQPSRPDFVIDDSEPRANLDLAGREIVNILREQLPGYMGADLLIRPGQVVAWVQTTHGPVEIGLPRRLLSAANPHQLLVIVFLASVLMAGIAFQFLRLQVRPIRRLGEAAEAYGRGSNVPIKTSGAREIRAASLAFVDMRNRIERQNAQRKIMLSGISHDMRTPLTRMRLILAMVEESEDTTALQTEIADLERLLNGFLDYSRGQGASVMQMTNLTALVRDLVGRYPATGGQVTCSFPLEEIPDVPVDKALIDRALDNLLSNALRYGTRTHVSMVTKDRSILLVVEDDGPGIDPIDRARAVEPFIRLDDARNQDAGSGVGLGLSIVAEAARAHSGSLALDTSPSMGGLRATLRLPVPPVHKSYSAPNFSSR